MAADVMNLVHDMSLKLPRDLSVAGCDDTPIARCDCELVIRNSVS